ncbi:Nitrate transporter 1.4 [Platanthera zijinensis]|uniref:Nitrate transporter 1.4 n=1 Tax=Platanthera zijinensis TaxID=2320716 RepID=A0AAP0BG42_9ASPA
MEYINAGGVWNGGGGGRPGPAGISLSAWWWDMSIHHRSLEENMSRQMTDAVDYRGFPADISKTGGWLPAALILGIEICERLTTMGIAVNLVTYLIGSMHLPSAESANIVTDFMGTSFMLCLLGGFLADSFFGRYLTIAIFTLLQLTGTGMLTVVSELPQLRPPPCTSAQNCRPASNVQRFMFFLSLYIISLGTGGLKSSVSGFGADQFDENDDREKTQMSYFFNRFFLFISTGTLFAVTVLVYVQDRVGRSLAYGICCAAMAAALALFLLGTKKYRYKKKSLESPLLCVLQVMVAALRKRKIAVSGDRFFYGDQQQGKKKRILPSNKLGFLNKAAMMEEGDIIQSRRNSWRLCAVSRVEEVKMMIRLLPVWGTTILFWTVYAQMITFSVEQAATMERAVGKSFQIPAGSFTVFFVGAIIITLAIYDRLVMPWWKKYRGFTGLTSLQKIGIGLLLSSIGMATAAAVETKRLAVARQVATPMKMPAPAATNTAGTWPENTLPISAFILVPQFILVGAAEAFVYTGQLDFFITRSPKGMKTMSTGIFLSTISLGFFLSSLLVSAVKTITDEEGKPWLGDSINNGRLDCFYGLLAVLSALNFVCYLFCAVKSSGKEEEVEEEDDDDKC